MIRSSRTTQNGPFRLPGRQSAFTLIELVISLSASSILIAGMATAVFVSMRASDTALTATEARIVGIAFLEELKSELQYSLQYSETDPRALTFTVHDRADADSNADTIRIAWSGAPDAPIIRRYNWGVESTLLESVHSFVLTYNVIDSTIVSIDVSLSVATNPTENLQMTIRRLNP